MAFELLLSELDESAHLFEDEYALICQWLATGEGAHRAGNSLLPSSSPVLASTGSSAAGLGRLRRPALGAAVSIGRAAC